MSLSDQAPISGRLNDKKLTDYVRARGNVLTLEVILAPSG
jgi:hypothetical protein